MATTNLADHCCVPLLGRILQEKVKDMKSLVVPSITALLLASFVIAPIFAEEAEETPVIDLKAKEIIERAVDFLASARQFRVSAEIWQDLEIKSGEMAQFSKVVDVQLRRPDRLRLDVTTSMPKRSFYYDGASLTVLDRVTRLFATGKTPATIDETLELAEEKLGFSFPLEDLLLSRPFGDGASKATAGRYYGLEPILGVMCHHLSFRNEVIDWQAWIEDGPVPLMRNARWSGCKRDPSSADRSEEFAADAFPFWPRFEIPSAISIDMKC